LHVHNDFLFLRSLRAFKRSREFRWAAAFFPDSKPALCRRKIPVHTESTALHPLACSERKRTSAGLSAIIKIIQMARADPIEKKVRPDVYALSLGFRDT